MIAAGTDPHRLDAGLRPAERAHHQARSPAQPLVVPEGAVVVPGARAVTVGRGPRVGPLAGDAGHREVPRREDRRAHGARSVDALRPRRADARARRHRLDDRPRGSRLRAGSPTTCARAASRSREQPVDDGARQRARDFARPRARGRALDALRLRAAVLPEPRRGRPALRPRRVRRQGHPRRAGGRRRAACAQTGETRVGLLFVVGEERGSDGARPPTRSRPGSRFLVNGEPTDSRLGRRRRAACCALKLRADGRAAHSSQPAARRVGHRQAARRARRAARAARCPRTRSSADVLHDRPDRGRRRAERRLARGRGRGDVPHRRPGAEIRRPPRAAARPRSAIEHVLEVPPVRLHTVPGFETRGRSPSPPTSRCCRAGARRCCSARARSSSPTPTTSTSSSTSSQASVDAYMRIARGLLDRGAITI